MREIRTLTGLRGWAALWVCVYHYSPDKHFGAFTQLAGAGHYGVPVFFILSGFIMAHVYGRAFAAGSQPFGQFMALRLARIYPLHLVTWLAVGAMIWWGYRAAGAHDTPASFVAGLLLVHGWGVVPPISWNEPAWSLSAEMLSYLLFPLFAGSLARARGAIASAVIACALLVVQWQVFDRLGPAFVLTYGGGVLYWVAMFAAGAALHRLLEVVPLGRAADVYLAVGLAMLVGLAGWGSPTWWQLMTASMLVIAGLAPDAGLGRVLFGNRLSVWLGAVSVALYLSHLALVHGWVYLLGEYAPGVYWYQVPLTVQVGSALVLAALLHYGVEKPARGFLRAAAKREVTKKDPRSLPAAGV